MGREVLRDLSLSLTKGQVLSIIGENGSGKTTLLNSIKGIQRLAKGEVLLNNKLVPDPLEILIPGEKNVGYVSQNLNYDRFLSVKGNLLEELKGLTNEAKNARLMEITSFCHIDHLLEKKVEHLSGGERQRITLAKALINEVDLFLLDEPCSHLDTVNKSLMKSIVYSLIEQKQTLILVSHDFDEVLKVSDRVLVLKDGEVEQLGSPEEIYSQPKTDYVASLFGHNIYIENRGWLRLESLNFESNKAGEFTVLRQFESDHSDCKAVIEYQGKRYITFLSKTFKMGERLSLT
jgi:iron(III) transport system ATP-binding protein